MKKTIILQSDVGKDEVCVMSTERFLKPVKLVSVVFPPEPATAGWTEVRIAVANSPILGIEGWGDVREITYNLFSIQKLYLPEFAVDTECEYKLFRVPAWFVFYIKNKTVREHLYTFLLDVEI